ncbi:MAG: hypothetical protein ACRC2S_16030 [Waterburya sp.]
MSNNVTYLTPIILKHVSGKYLSHFYEGRDSYFPTLRDGNIALLKFHLASDPTNTGSVNSLAKISIECLEGGLSKYFWMGAFSDSKYVYYWEEYGDKTNWIISSSSSSGDIHFGDLVTLKNVNYAKYGFTPVDYGSSSEPYQLLIQTDPKDDSMNFTVEPAP